MRMSAAHFQQAFLQCRPLQRELYRYTHAKLALARQTVACNRFHAVEARLARWLLMTSDRVLSEQFSPDAGLLGGHARVRRATVNEAAGALQQRNLISLQPRQDQDSRSQGLEAAACRCYARIERPRLVMRPHVARPDAGRCGARFGSPPDARAFPDVSSATMYMTCSHVLPAVQPEALPQAIPAAHLQVHGPRAQPVEDRRYRGGVALVRPHELAQRFSLELRPSVAQGMFPAQVSSCAFVEGGSASRMFDIPRCRKGCHPWSA